MCPSAYRVTGPQAQLGRGGGVEPAPKPSLDRWGMCVQNFIKIGAGVCISISPPNTNRLIDRQTNICTSIYIYIYVLWPYD